MKQLKFDRYKFSINTYVYIKDHEYFKGWHRVTAVNFQNRAVEVRGSKYRLVYARQIKKLREVTND